MHSTTLKLCLLTALLALAACTPSSPPTDAVVYEGARLIVGDGSAPIENAVFVVENGQFTLAGAASAVEAPAGGARVDLTGMTVMPAIIDTHIHPNRERETLITDLKLRAAYGVSAVLSLGQDPDTAPLEIRDEDIPGAARYRSAGRGITAPEPGRTEIPHWVTTAEEARQAVREEAAREVDIIKLWVDDRTGQHQKLSPELYTAAIDEAHKAGVRVTAHLFTLEDAKGLLNAGMDAFAHGVRDMDIDDEVVALFKQNPNFVLVPNLPGRGVAVDMSWLSASLPAEEVAKLQAAAVDNPVAQAAFGIQARNLARLNVEGITIALGSDGNTPWASHVEMEDMVASGMTPAEVITAATKNGADFLRLTDAGTVSAGKRADFLVLEANPLDDITNTRRISAVYLQGTKVDR
jgi:imidazolonepropionase-like amidohydrolase